MGAGAYDPQMMPEQHGAKPAVGLPEHGVQQPNHAVADPSVTLVDRGWGSANQIRVVTFFDGLFPNRGESTTNKKRRRAWELHVSPFLIGDKKARFAEVKAKVQQRICYSIFPPRPVRFQAI